MPQPIVINGGITKLLFSLLGLALTIIGLLVGHITTRAAMLEDRTSIIRKVEETYVPRKELEVQLNAIGASG